MFLSLSFKGDGYLSWEEFQKISNNTVMSQGRLSKIEIWKTSVASFIIIYYYYCSISIFDEFSRASTENISTL